jgi:hypothetical protein
VHRRTATRPASSHPPRPLATLAAVAVAAALLAAPASAQWTFTRVADLATPVPGEGGVTFEDLPTDYGEDAPSAAGTQVLFWGLWDASVDRHHGLFLFSDGTLSRVVDEAQTRPEGGGVTYGDINPAASLAGGATAFVSDGNPFDGVYRVAGGTHTRIADETATVPGQGETTFVDLSPPSMNAGQVAFFGRYDGGAAVLLHDGSSLQILADTDMVAPGSSEEFSAYLAWPSLDAGQVAFLAELGNGGGSGLYLWNGSSVQRIADSTTPDPRGSGGTFFFTFGYPAPSLDAGQIAFRSQLLTPVPGGSLGTNGVFLWNGSALVTIAQDGDPRPDGGTFGFDSRQDWVSTSQGLVVFTSNGAEALYLYEGGAITRLIGVGDVLDGETVDEVFIGPEALSGQCLAFAMIEEADSAPSVYRACLNLPAVSDIPTLGEIGSLLLAALLAGVALLTLRRVL